MKCLVSENEGDYQAAGEDETCTNFKGSLNAVSVFQIEATPKNHFYPFDGLRTMNEAKAFCESQGGPFSGPGTKFGLDDDNAQTEGNKLYTVYYLFIRHTSFSKHEVSLFWTHSG